MIKGLALFDYDGTLVDEKAGVFQPTIKTREAIRTLQDNGYICALATGRARCYSPVDLSDLSFDAMITSNGATIHYGDKTIGDEGMPASDVEKVRIYCSKQGSNYILDSDKHCFVKDLDEKSYLFFMNNFGIPKDAFVDAAKYDENAHKITKITIVCNNQQQYEKMKAHFGKEYVISVHAKCLTFDLTRFGMNKGCGVTALIEELDIPFEHTIAFGDGDNDVEMLQSVKYGIAMTPHHQALNDATDLFTDSVSEEGIYIALKKLEVI